MTERPRLLIFSDLDGTLLDHQTYQWTAARDALGALKEAGAGLVLASSKTAAEIAPLRAAIGFQNWPAIVENGAGLLPAGAVCDALSERYDALRTALANVPTDLRALFTGFGDLDAAGVAAVTGLSPKAAGLAKQRAFSEPGTWTGTVQELDQFLNHLATQGITAQRGGRFVTLSFGGNKADRVADLTQRYSPRHTIALGDAPNDIKMLETADIGVVIANPHSAPLPPLKGEGAGKIIRTTEAGPSGWNAAILSLIKQLTD
ncbi:HAD-IIB family hydrolase [Thalassovita mediterranea]|jgi:mannosyl-3-phosphoglycerate phosphatase|uniref:Glucosyl-3-phosphoglycerate/mannosyl-3-phosphoglycerate phosphatase n=1 Tax=Thalassovita mediterranea TaxID=340021 RepID=A0A0P1GMF4_9RHOB|nr:HAD-IIB family hydrolase [Thalassovita mediterranea]CUH83280.1 Glucosyl-3-phosphoglycerate/mannosyl-3-phosphoglycerate phosphatase [Thalassovita mediterranea]SIS33821.1 mannosyl-3-phosphoglycerate phosphatase [Thalassovita mediterranea]